MKKWFFTIIFSLLFLIQIFITLTYADIMVCGHPANSRAGYGRVIICGTTYDCKLSPSDYVCPEDFEDSAGFRANCSSCPDIDCTVNVSGYVKDMKNNPVYNATVSYIIPNFNVSVSTDVFGYYSLVVLSGINSLVASKPGYDSVVKEITFSRGNLYNVNFSLPKGECNADCTNSLGRCAVECDGLIFNYSLDSKCDFFSSTAKYVCNNKIKGARVLYGKNITNPDYSLYIDCCEGVPYNIFNPIVELTGNVNNLIKYSRLVQYNGRPVKLIIAVWDKE
ncbi:MAG: carboxypeptidase-like regulatory domain-containing protein [Candidatus Woesearchaeota archaeon]